MTEVPKPPPSPAIVQPEPSRGPTVQPIPRGLVAIGVPVVALVAVTAVAPLLELRVDT